MYMEKKNIMITKRKARSITLSCKRLWESLSQFIREEIFTETIYTSMMSCVRYSFWKTRTMIPTLLDTESLFCLKILLTISTKQVEVYQKSKSWIHLLFIKQWVLPTLLRILGK